MPDPALASQAPPMARLWNCQIGAFSNFKRTVQSRQPRLVEPDRDLQARKMLRQRRVFKRVV